MLPSGFRTRRIRSTALEEDWSPYRGTILHDVVIPDLVSRCFRYLRDSRALFAPFAAFEPEQAESIQRGVDVTDGAASDCQLTDDGDAARTAAPRRRSSARRTPRAPASASR
jgi:hypothetical protein